MARVTPGKIPERLKTTPNWVVWKTVERSGKLTKVPFQPNGDEAKSNDPRTWSVYADAMTAYCRGIYDGPGFVFQADGGLCGVDLDGCRDPEAGKVADWAREIIQRMNTYAEVSPSTTGVKLFCRGKSPFDTGKKKTLAVEKVTDKEPGIEIYDRLRYFAVTGWRLQGPTEPRECQDELDWIKSEFWPDATGPVEGGFYGDDAVIDRARKYLTKLPPAVSGSSGHNAAFHAACVLVLGFGLTKESALTVMREYNQTCKPPWSEYELQHKIDSAFLQRGPRNYLRNVQPVRWDSVALPSYTPPQGTYGPRVTTLTAAARSYLDMLRDGGAGLLSLGIPDIDACIGGGVERGEVIVIAARPSHGKSCVALQSVHHWTENDMPVLVISEEMSALAIGKRSLQFITETPQEYWPNYTEIIGKELDAYAEHRKPALIVEACRNVNAAVEQIDKAVEEHKIQAVVVDYAQLLGGKGKSRYEEITNTSIAIRQITSRHKLVTLMLCQLNREIERRDAFLPRISDLRDSGQIEQDADVIIFLVWPHRIDNKRNPKEYLFFFGKNRNRAINARTITCEFKPDRQMIVSQPPKNTSATHYTEFDRYDGSHEDDF